MPLSSFTSTELMVLAGAIPEGSTLPLLFNSSSPLPNRSIVMVPAILLCEVPLLTSTKKVVPAATPSTV